MVILWTPDSRVRRSLLAEKDWDQIKRENPDLQVMQEEKVRFRPYGTNGYLPVLRAVHVELQCKARKRENVKLYVIKGQEESLLGQYDSVSNIRMRQGLVLLFISEFLSNRLYPLFSVLFLHIKITHLLSDMGWLNVEGRTLSSL